MEINKLLEEQLAGECDRLTMIIDHSEEGGDEWKDAYAKKLAILEKMKDFVKAEMEFSVKRESNDVERKKLEMTEELEKMKLDSHEKVETIRREAELALEREKQKISWKRIGLEFGKVLLPLFLTIAHYNHAQKKIFDFEEHGRITSTPGRQLGLPRIFK